tara:strand:- start:1406 stop:1639 length:234 start_codon:yes stop_codon:yes gene_type:complete
MKIKLSELKQIIKEETVSASSEYMKKENVREQLQNMVLELIKNGDITSDDDIKEFFGTVEMASNTLKMIPFMVYNKL